MQKFGHEGWSYPPSRVLKGTYICRKIGWPLNKRMYEEVTKLESKHRSTQEMPNFVCVCVSRGGGGLFCVL